MFTNIIGLYLYVYKYKRLEREVKVKDVYGFHEWRNDYRTESLDNITILNMEHKTQCRGRVHRNNLMKQSDLQGKPLGRPNAWARGVKHFLEA